MQENKLKDLQIIAVYVKHWWFLFYMNISFHPGYNAFYKYENVKEV